MLIDRICDGLFVFKNQQITYCNGGYSSYIDISEQQNKNKSDGALKYKEQKKLQSAIRLSFKEKQELENMEKVILEFEQQIKIINEQMNEYQSNYNKLSELSNQRDYLNEQLEIKNERWLELLEKQEQSQK